MNHWVTRHRGHLPNLPAIGNGEPTRPAIVSPGAPDGEPPAVRTPASAASREGVRKAHGTPMTCAPASGTGALSTTGALPSTSPQICSRRPASQAKRIVTQRIDDWRTMVDYVMSHASSDWQVFNIASPISRSGSRNFHWGATDSGPA